MNTATTMNLNEMIKACCYTEVSKNMTESNFPKPENLDVCRDEDLARPFCFNRRVHTVEAIRLMDEAGYRPASIWDLLYLVSKSIYWGNTDRILVAIEPVELRPGLRVATVHELERGFKGCCTKKKLSCDDSDCDWGKSVEFIGIRK